MRAGTAPVCRRSVRVVILRRVGASDWHAGVSLSTMDGESVTSSTSDGRRARSDHLTRGVKADAHAWIMFVRDVIPS